MMFVKPPYGKVSRFVIDSNYALEKLKKYVYGYLPCYTCDHRLHDHVSYDHLSDWNGVCVSNHTKDGDCCGCTEYNLSNHFRYCFHNLRLWHNLNITQRL